MKPPVLIDIELIGASEKTHERLRIVKFILDIGEDEETLLVRPGLTSEGTLLYYLRLEHDIEAHDPERSYVERALRPKLAADRAAFSKASVLSDVSLVFRTAGAIAATAIRATVGGGHRRVGTA